MLREQEPGLRLSRAVQVSLLVGLGLSGLLLCVGLALVLSRPAPDLETAPAGLSALLTRARTGDGAALLDLGLVLLMLTPVARVGVLTAGWALSREWTLAAVALGVLVLLVVSLLLGIH